MTGRKLLFSLILLLISPWLMRFSGWFGIGLFVGLILTILYSFDYTAEIHRRGVHTAGQNIVYWLLRVPQLLFGLLAVGIGLVLAIWVFYNMLIERLPEYSSGPLGWFIIPALLLFGLNKLRLLFASPATPTTSTPRNAAMQHILPDHPVFAPYRDSLLASARPCAAITLRPCETLTDTLTPWQSKLGGLPYLPHEADYPHDSQGRPLYLLAQINCAEVPPLPDFPHRGMLQFFISPYATLVHLWGLDYHHPDRQDYFRVLYYPEVHTDPAAVQQDFAFLPPLPTPPAAMTWTQKLLGLFKKPALHLPFQYPCAMHFTAGEQLVPLDDAALHLSGAGVPDVDAGNWFDPRFAGEELPRLADAARVCREHGLAANVEIKPCPGREAETGRIVATECARGWQRAAVPPLLSSFSPEALLAARAAAPQLNLGWLIEGTLPADWLAQARTLGVMALHLEHALVDAPLVGAAHAAGLAVLAWTVNDLATARRLRTLGVDALCTDAPDELAAG